MSRNTLPEDVTLLLTKIYEKKDVTVSIYLKGIRVKLYYTRKWKSKIGTNLPTG